MAIYTSSIEELIASANVVKENVILALEREGHLKRPAAELIKEYAVVIHRKSWLGLAWEALFDGIKSDLRVDVVKRIS